MLEDELKRQQEELTRIIGEQMRQQADSMFTQTLWASTAGTYVHTPNIDAEKERLLMENAALKVEMESMRQKLDIAAARLLHVSKQQTNGNNLPVFLNDKKKLLWLISRVHPDHNPEDQAIANEITGSLLAIRKKLE